MTPTLETAAARIEADGAVLVDGLTVTLTRRRCVVVGDAGPLLAPLFGTGTLTRGWVKIRGRKLDEAREELGLAPLDPPLPGDMAPLAYVLWSALLAGLAPEEARAATVRVCAAVGLGTYAKVPFSRLGPVPRRLAVLAHAAVASPRLLIVEAPIVNLADDAAFTVLKGLDALVGDGHVVVTTPRFEPGTPADALARGADEVVLIERGAVVEQGSPHDLAGDHADAIAPTEPAPTELAPKREEPSEPPKPDQ